MGPVGVDAPFKGAPLHNAVFQSVEAGANPSIEFDWEENEFTGCPVHITWNEASCWRHREGEYLALKILERILKLLVGRRSKTKKPPQAILI
jgi:hypothetical protein